MGCGSSDASATPEATQDDEVSALATSSAVTTKSLKSYTSSKLKSSPTTRYADSLKKSRSVALLGSGDSGKSTVITRLKMLDTQQSVEEKDVGTLMWNNVIESMSALVFFCVSANLEMPESTLTTAFKKFDKSVDLHRTAELAAEITALWQDASIQAAFRRRSEFTLLTNTEYMMSRLDMLADPDFEPSVEDNLQARLKTTVAVPVHLELGGCKVDMVDLGGTTSSGGVQCSCGAGVTRTFAIGVRRF
jgi:guanine nucleotide-binding protein subunit alpha